MGFCHYKEISDNNAFIICLSFTLCFGYLEIHNFPESAQSIEERKQVHFMHKIVDNFWKSRLSDERTDSKQGEKITILPPRPILLTLEMSSS